MKPILRIENLGKQYRLGPKAESYGMLRDVFVNALKAPLKLGRRHRSSDAERLWALHNVSFDVAPGEVVGIVGRNGAGKSTLLKVLSRITHPTEGRVEVYGRVGSLLEVGTGFHPELTGRENVFLNGAILGMRRPEILSKFDQIVDFADVEKFLDTPVKYYSSGMYMRLAFAVAAHLEPEILVVDEVLAVGDASFQKKCIGKMQEVSKGGRTVLFVSHNVAALEALCSRCILLINGQLDSMGPTSDITTKYLQQSLMLPSGNVDLTKHSGRTGGSKQIMTDVALLSKENIPTSAIRMGSPFSLRIGFRNTEAMKPRIGVVVRNSLSMPLFGQNNQIMGVSSDSIAAGTSFCRFESHPLMPGTYSVDLFFGDQKDTGHDIDNIRDAISFEVTPADVTGTGKLPNAVCGPIYLPALWSFEENRRSESV